MAEAMAMMTISCPEAKPGIERVAEILGVGTEAVDRSFGVVAFDPSRGLYAVQVRADAIERREGSGSDSCDGPYANPRIDGFGPPDR